MREHYEMLRKAEDPEKRRALYEGKHQMSREVYHLTLSYLRGFRAYLFKNSESEKRTAKIKQQADLNKKTFKECIVTYEDVCKYLKHFFETLL